MDWLWSAKSKKPSSEAQNLPQTHNSAPEPPSSALPPQPSASSKPPTRDELADQELASFLREVTASEQPAPPKYVRANASPSPPTKEETLASSLLPTTMRCRDAFDSAFYCQSLGGQFTNVYRFGGMRDCSEHWSDFWFCMKARSSAGERKEEMIRERWREKEDRKYNRERGGMSSEDVWRAREEKVEKGSVFRRKFEEDGVSILGGKEEKGE